MDLYRSENGTAFLDPRGFLEIVVAQHSMFTLEEGHALAAALVARGIKETPVLISRINEYAVPKSFNVLDLAEIGEVKFRKIAVYAPSPGDQTFSHLMGMTAFKNVPTGFFRSGTRRSAGSSPRAEILPKPRRLGSGKAKNNFWSAGLNRAGRDAAATRFPPPRRC